MMEGHSSPGPARGTLTVVPGVVTPLSDSPLVGAVVTLQPGRVGHLRVGSFACFCPTDFHPAFAAPRDGGPPCLAIASVTQQGILGPCDHDQSRSAVRTLLGRKGHKGHGAKRRRLDFDGLAWQDRYGLAVTTRQGFCLRSRKSPGNDDQGRQTLTNDEQRFP